MARAQRVPGRSGGGLPAPANPFPASRSPFSRCRIWRSKRASAAPNTGLSSPPPIQPPSRTSSRNWSSGSGSSRSLRTLPAISKAQGLAAVLTVDRDTAARFGITLATIDNALYDAFGQRIVSTIFTQSNQRRVILETDPSFTPSVDSLLRLYLPSSTATSGEVPLSAIAQVAVKPAPLLISHFGPFPAATISFNLAPGVSLGEAVETVRKVEQEIGLPPGMTTHFQGAALAFEASLTNELWLILAALVCVYIVLGILYESFIHPVTILSTLPSAGVGALLALMAARMDLGVIGIIGIVSVDRHRQEERDHDDRFRPASGAAATAFRRARRSSRLAFCGCGRS